MKLLLRGVRVIEPHRGTDLAPRDVLISDGCIAAIDHTVTAETDVVIDLRRHEDAERCVVAPAFIDLHAHLREPGDEDAETVQSGAQAAAAGGFATVLAMANTRPPVDTPERVAAALQRNGAAAVTVMQAAAVSRNLDGVLLTGIEDCVAAGAAAFSDDGRNAFGSDVLVQALRRAADCDRGVLVHPEDEALIASLGTPGTPLVRCALRPAEAEHRAVATALEALRVAGRGRLHLQHLSTATALDLVRQAKDEGLRVTAEVTPHHATMRHHPDAQRRVNPPLRDESDVAAVQRALADGTADAIATDHAPHVAAAKEGDHDDAAPGMIGLETALSACLALVPPALSMATLVERLTLGPWAVLQHMPPPALRIGEPATLVVFDPAASWRVEAKDLRSKSANTPLIGEELQGRVLLTMVNGRIAHCHETLSAARAKEATHV
ncbi:MAG: dihydroorotase [Candidatus Dormibacteraeota bacterium]|nr:dihydroorotase [Candidatus Dormibacteraeota bacterium]